MLVEPMLAQADDYYWIMAARGRLVSVDDGRTALCTFFVLHDESEISRYYPRSYWSTPTDCEEGTLIFVDKLISRHMTRQLFRAIVHLMTDRFPQWKTAVWYRPGRAADRKYTLMRRAHG